MSRPLKGRKILVTRSRSQAGEFSRLLRQAGAEVAEIPAIEIVPRPDRELDACISRVHRFDWIFFTSVNGAEIFLSRAREVASHLFQKDSPSPRICAIGPATARRLERFGWEVHLVPARYQAEGVLEAFLERHANRIEGLSILIPRASQARSLLPRELSRHGARVEVVPVYDTVVPEESRSALKQAARRRRARPHHLHQFLNSSTPDESGNRSGSSPVCSLRRHRSDHGGYCPRTWVSGGRRIPAVNHPEPVRRYLSKLQPIGKRKIKGR